MSWYHSQLGRDYFVLEGVWGLRDLTYCLQYLFGWQRHCCFCSRSPLRLCISSTLGSTLRKLLCQFLSFWYFTFHGKDLWLGPPTSNYHMLRTVFCKLSRFPSLELTFSKCFTLVYERKAPTHPCICRKRAVLHRKPAAKVRKLFHTCISPSLSHAYSWSSR